MDIIGRKAILRIHSTNLNLCELHYYRVLLNDKVYSSDFQYNGGLLELDFDINLNCDKIRI